MPYVAGQQNFGHLAPFFATLGADPANPLTQDDATNAVGKFYGYDYDGDDTSDDTIACQSLVIEFINNSSGTGTLTYAWDFGDGTNSTDESPIKLFDTPGSYDVQLAVTNGADFDT